MKKFTVLCALVFVFGTFDFAIAYYGEYSGSFDGTGPNWNSPNCMMIYGFPLVSEYNVYEFTSDISSPHRIEITTQNIVGGWMVMGGPPGYELDNPLLLYLYEGSFDPENPHDNLVHDWFEELENFIRVGQEQGNDNTLIPLGFEYPLIAGNTYFVVSAPLDPFGEGDFTNRISVVPIPSAIWLLVSGLIGLVGFRRKFRKL